ncbi:MAG: class I SAM-dependent methyltransferase [Pseudooceanicola sp.]|nr:class I SAM-dependent methyltransferase [Pseudooceanicola sp.]
MSQRLTLALEGGGLALPAEGRIAVLYPGAEADLGVLPRDRVVVVQPNYPDHAALKARWTCAVDLPEGPLAAALVIVPRAKALAHDLVARACAAPLVIVDGAKTDGVDALLKEIRTRVTIQGPVVKAHGKLFWFTPSPGAFDDWRAPTPAPVDGFLTAPGSFSADGIDPASKLLGDTLPVELGRRVADLGAGWGYLSSRVLERAKVERVDLVEADNAALACARANLPDPRAHFHWADARDWAADSRVDTVVMNPPFHTGRAADTGLGRAFIQAAARLLGPSGQLWMVANRHLPYESTLTQCFAEVREAAGDTRFKVHHATRPRRRA